MRGTRLNAPSLLRYCELQAYLADMTQSGEYAFMRSSSAISSFTRALGLGKAAFLTWDLILVFERAG